MEPLAYETWYHTARGSWIAGVEWKSLRDLMQPKADMTLLDVGCGTGYFSRLFAQAGLHVTALDPHRSALTYARQQGGEIKYLQADALTLPFTNDSFDYVSAITSLCFVEPPQQALQEMWRVTRRGLVLGLLNKYSLLYWQKRHSKSYAGARWDRINTFRKWVENLDPKPVRASDSNGVLLAKGGKLSNLAEKTLGKFLPFGAFIAMYIEKSLT
jgi:SAM-dependent methyltransferase